MDKRKIKITVEQWERTCPECGRIISGVNEKQLDWNFSIHHQSCRDKRKVDEE